MIYFAFELKEMELCKLKLYLASMQLAGLHTGSVNEKTVYKTVYIKKTQNWITRHRRG